MTLSQSSVIIGHELQRRYLRGLIDSDRLPQSIVLSGKSGIGKALVAREAILYSFCSADKQMRPCGVCKHCKTLSAGTHPDLIELNPDAKGAIRIGEADEPGSVRWMVARLGQKAIYGKYAVIVNGCDAIQENAQNALLKTLEEASAGTAIYLITSSLSSLLTTIKSRSMLLQFSPLSIEHIKSMRSPFNHLAALFCGGSPALYDHFSQDDIAGTFLDALRSVKAFFEEHKKIDIDFKGLSATFAEGAPMAIDALLGFYDFNLSRVLTGTGEIEEEISRYLLKDSDSVRIVIRALLALRRDMVFHINSSLAFSCHLKEDIMKMGNL